MAGKQLKQEKVNGIVNARLKRERERLAKDFEKRLKRCMAIISQTLFQEICLIKSELESEAKDTLLSGESQAENRIGVGFINNDLQTTPGRKEGLK